MVIVHNIIIRGLNSIYVQAPHVKPGDYADFIGYCLCFSGVCIHIIMGSRALSFLELRKVLEWKGLWMSIVSNMVRFKKYIKRARRKA